MVVVVPVGLILLVGPPAAGKSSFARAWVALGRIDANAVISADAIRRKLFGDAIRGPDDGVVFAEVDRRIQALLADGEPAVVDATNVTIPARARLIVHARHYCRPVTASRFRVPDAELLRRNATRGRPPLGPRPPEPNAAWPPELNAAQPSATAAEPSATADRPFRRWGLGRPSRTPVRRR